MTYLRNFCESTVKDKNNTHSKINKIYIDFYIIKIYDNNNKIK